MGSYLGELYYHYKDTTKINHIISNAKQFNKWYAEVVEDMPIVSCYTLSNPLTGNYHGFLSSLSSATGKKVTDKQLTSNLEQFDALKVEARQFMKRHSVKLISPRNRLVQASIDIAYGKQFDAEKFSQMFSDMMQREQWVIDWWEQQAHEWKFRELRDSSSCSESKSSAQSSKKKNKKKRTSN